ncbi:hypothetical protein PVK06_035151 [Gossypium arboreum]|uniref:Phosphoglycerate kinase n=1 Tax=Gossypium arboreum TaxID=29729 RepID=A0ABR0NID1_GOSAR|nr:hypothetical protein PVK06_035151 [Gossypium arboreum]
MVFNRSATTIATKKSVGDLKEADLKGKKVFVRVDLNVPLDDNFNITDDTRICVAVSTIKYLVGHGSKVILSFHLDEQPEVQGPAVLVSTERGSTISPIEYSDVAAVSKHFLNSGFRDFLLKPELFRSIVDSGFEHPSEGKVLNSSHLYVDKLCRSLGCIKSRLSFLHSLIKDARGKVDKEITTSHPSLCVIRGILQSKTSSSNSKVLILAKQVFWWSLKNLLMSMGLSWNELSSFCTNANPSGQLNKVVTAGHRKYTIELDDSSNSKSLYEGVDIPQIAKKLTFVFEVEKISLGRVRGA